MPDEGETGFVTAIVALPWLSAGFGSAVLELAEATFVSVCPAAAFVGDAVIVTFAVVSSGSWPSVQVTTLPAALQPGEADTNVSPAGRLSVT